MIYKKNDFYTLDLSNHNTWDGIAVCRCMHVYHPHNSTKKLNLVPVRIIQPSRPGYRDLRVGFQVKIWDDDMKYLKIDIVDKKEYPEYFL